MKNETINDRDILIYLSLKHNGDWKAIYDDIVQHASCDKEEVLSMVSKVKAKTLTMLDKEYPEYLKYVLRPPFVLYYYGDISLISDYSKNISIVGSRNYSSYGEVITREIARTVCKEFNIVSGMAAGIDSIAHDETIRRGGRTIAILCTGIDKCYPATNLSLYEELKSHHLVMSEYPGKSVPPKEGIPFRNRLIAAMSLLTVVTEAHTRSGTSITTGFALEMGKDVCCVPYPYTADSLCNKLIATGASLVQSGKDVLEEASFARIKKS